MNFEKGQLYHIYNQGNNRQKIFFKRENYLFFLTKVSIHLLPFCDVIAYCLMPNHFHFMVKVFDVGGATPNAISGGATPSRTPANTLNKSIGILLASYTRAIHKQNRVSGSLFRKNTKAECLTCSNGITPSFYNTQKGAQINIDNPERQYPQLCFDYIHQNPVKAGLVRNIEDWEFSSARDYIGLRSGKLINTEVANENIIL